MKGIQIISTALLSLCLLSCAPKYVAISTADSKNAFILNSSPTFKGYFYQGSDDDFHYFISKWKYSGNKAFKINSKELTVISPFEFNSKEVGVSPIKSDEKFASNTHYSLYMIL
jgi:hypothetical protein